MVYTRCMKRGSITRHKKNALLAFLLTVGIMLGVISVSTAMLSSDDNGAKTAGESTMMISRSILYLYPTRTTDVMVGFDTDVIVVKDYLDSDIEKKTLGLVAYANGELVDRYGKRRFGLIWEAKVVSKSETLNGYVIAGDQTELFLRDTLRHLGLTERETDEFVSYWSPVLSGNRYNLIHFDVQNETKVKVEPSPDSEVKIVMSYESMDSWRAVDPQKIDKFNRRGFSVVELGGFEIVD
jgi:hypothetical protein